MQFPQYIDNTMLKSLRRCPQYLQRRYLEGLKPADESLSIDLHFGACFARGIEVTRKSFFEAGRNASEALDAGLEAADMQWVSQTLKVSPKSAKTRVNLISALAYYWQTWPMETDELKPIAIEETFSVPIPLMHPESGQPLSYVGRCDMVARNAMDDVVVVDEKTAGSFSNAWMAQWDTDPQMTGYLWAMTQQGYTVSHALIRGIAVSKTYGVEHALTPVFRTAWQLGDWYEQMLRDVQRMVALYKEGKFDKALGSACTAYGRPCEFQRLCTTPNPQQFVDASYKVEFWNPLAVKDK